MFTREELVDAINQISSSTHHSIQNCEKLAAIYTVLDHISPTVREPEHSYDNKSGSETVGRYGNSEFLNLITGKDPHEVWKIMNEMVEAVAVFNPKLHRAVLSRLSSLDDKIIN